MRTSWGHLGAVFGRLEVVIGTSWGSLRRPLTSPLRARCTPDQTAQLGTAISDSDLGQRAWYMHQRRLYSTGAKRKAWSFCFHVSNCSDVIWNSGHDNRSFMSDPHRCKTMLPSRSPGCSSTHLCRDTLAILDCRAAWYTHQRQLLYVCLFFVCLFTCLLACLLACIVCLFDTSVPILAPSVPNGRYPP